MKKSSLGSAKRFGTRYGKALKEKLARVEASSKKLKSPITNKENGAKRLSKGIYVCKKTGVKIAGKAYSLK
jgi:ribosomal protein L37AE/L43A